MWDYLYDPELKEYIDTVQQEFRCCGATGSSDWYLTDWLRPSTYKQKYYMNLLGRQQLGLSAENESYYKLIHYGSPMAQRALVAQLDNPEATSRKRCELFFNEVPFSCCDPESPTFCRQMFANRVTFAYNPAENFTLMDVGCARAVTAAMLAEGRATVVPLWWPLAVKLAALLLYRLLQTSQASALAAGRHLSAARGWLLLLRPTRGGPPPEPLLDSSAASEASSTGNGDTTTEESDALTEDSSEPPPDDDAESDAVSDDIPPPPPMDDAE